MTTVRTSREEATHVARRALVSAAWACIVDASSMNVVMSGGEFNDAMNGYRAAIEAEVVDRIATAMPSLVTHWLMERGWAESYEYGRAEAEAFLMGLPLLRVTP